MKKKCFGYKKFKGNYFGHNCSGQKEKSVFLCKLYYSQ